MERNELERLLHAVYGSGIACLGEKVNLSKGGMLDLDSVEDFILQELQDTVVGSAELKEDVGRLGPKRVTFDVNSNLGHVMIHKDRLGVCSQSNFSTIRGNCCVYKGKWQYEVMLGSKGLMQIGWTMRHCHFSQKKGVGDTPDSYAFDGNRVLKWNVATFKYGEAWLTGDVIGCTLDLDECKVHFYKNGHCLGEAFDNVRVGPGLAYFPAVSLAYNENLVANFGATPLRFPVEGYSPLQLIPWKDKMKANKLLDFVEKIISLQLPPDKAIDFDPYHLQRHWSFSQLEFMLIAAPIMHHLAPLLVSPYVTEACLLPFLFRVNRGPSCHESEAWRVYNLLDLFWALMEPAEMHQCLELLTVGLLLGYRFSPVTMGFDLQKQHLQLTLSILSHMKTRKFLLQNVLFDKIKFPVFMEVKVLDQHALTDIVPEVWIDLGKEITSDEEKQRKSAYIASQERLKVAVAELEGIQLQVLEMLFADDSCQDQSSQRIFLSKFQDFLKENSDLNRVQASHICPLSAALAFFHRLFALLQKKLAQLDYNDPNSENAKSSDRFFVPMHIFLDEGLNSHECQRVGGLVSHLRKVFEHDVVEENCSFNHTDTSKGVAENHPESPPSSSQKDLEVARHALEELLDGLIHLYYISAHRQIGKMSGLHDSMSEYTEVLLTMEHHTDSSGDTQHARNVFRDKLAEQAQFLVWLRAVTFSKEKQATIYCLLKMILNSLNEASKKGPLFAFVPDYYVEACIRSYNALQLLFSPLLPMDTLEGHQDVLVKFVVFLTHHFADPRVVNADLKDTLIQALATCVCQPAALHALETMPVDSRIVMVQALLQPYENRAWAQSNWILVRIWKGCGFAFRYGAPPHLSKCMQVKVLQNNYTSTPSHQKPYPSKVLQQHVGDWLLGNPESAANFLSSLLSQMNWCFSEFIGMLQEIQNAYNRPERVFIDSRQLKICATCYDLTLSLLRVLELVVCVAPQLVTDSSRPLAEVLLTRLCQLICQVLNRVTSKAGCFHLVVNLEIPGLEIIHHFPILAAVLGILVALFLNGPPEGRQLATTALLAEPSFQPSSLDFLDMPVPYFNLDENEEVSDKEKQQLEQLLHTVQLHYKKACEEQDTKVIDEEELCTICYAMTKSICFQPCGHQSCRSCISLHLLQHKDCFFCKTPISQLMSLSGEVLSLSAITMLLNKT